MHPLNRADGLVVAVIPNYAHEPLPVLIPHSDTLPAFPFKKYKTQRRRETTRPEWIVRLGLSPWTLWPKCDICANSNDYMRRRGITNDQPVRIYGRYAAHLECYETEGKGMATMKLPTLDYRIVVSETLSNSATMLVGRMSVKLGKLSGHA